MKPRNKKLIGVGGINCYCCRKGSKKETRTKVNRADRRKTKQQNYSPFDDSQEYHESFA